MDEAKSWYCPSKRHIMGIVARNGSGIRQLLLYRHAVEGMESGEGRMPSAPTEVDVMAVVEGYVADVRCDICGQVRTWVPGEEAIQQLLQSRPHPQPLSADGPHPLPFSSRGEGGEKGI